MGTEGGGRREEGRMFHAEVYEKGRQRLGAAAGILRSCIFTFYCNGSTFLGIPLADKDARPAREGYSLISPPPPCLSSSRSLPQYLLYLGHIWPPSFMEAIICRNLGSHFEISFLVFLRSRGRPLCFLMKASGIGTFSSTRTTSDQWFLLWFRALIGP